MLLVLFHQCSWVLGNHSLETFIPDPAAGNDNPLWNRINNLTDSHKRLPSARLWLVDPHSIRHPAASDWSRRVCFAVPRLPPLRVFITNHIFLPPGAENALTLSPCQHCPTPTANDLTVKSGGGHLKAEIKGAAGKRAAAAGGSPRRYCPSRRRVVACCWTQPTTDLLKSNAFQLPAAPARCVDWKDLR